MNDKAVMVHGGMKYKCQECEKSWFMCLEVGVADQGRNGKPSQPCPFMTRCDCGGLAHDISGYIPLPSLRPLMPGMRYFAYDDSGDERACGKPMRYKEAANEQNQ